MIGATFDTLQKMFEHYCRPNFFLVYQLSKPKYPPLVLNNPNLDISRDGRFPKVALRGYKWL